MWSGFSWASGAWASQPQYGSAHPGIVICEDDTVMAVYGFDKSDLGIGFSEITTGGGAVYGGGSGSGGRVTGGDASDGSVSGGDERSG